MDIAVRRQLIVIEITKRIEKGEFEIARELIDKLLQFRTLNELDDMLSMRHSENSAAQLRAKEKVNELFNILRQQLSDHRRYFDRSMAEDLASKLEIARRKNP